MKKALIVGASKEGGFGNFLAEELKVRGTFSEVEVRRRGDSLNVEPADMVVINLFDHKVVARLQQAVFVRAFERLRDEDCLLVVMGSTVYHFEDHVYAQSKKNLKEKFYELGKNTDTYSCRLLLIEPGTMEYVRGEPAEGAHVSYRTVANVMRFARTTRQKFMHVALRG